MSLSFKEPLLPKAPSFDSLGELVKKSSEAEVGVRDFDLCLFSYPDDEGIQKNKGQVGAAQAPKAIKEILYKMTRSKINSKILDCGELQFDKNHSLEERHAFASEKVLEALSSGAKVLSFGGGHDYGYVDGRAFSKFTSDSSALIFNFDAHFDLRDLNHGITSGTPFYRLKEELQDQVEIVEIGLQRHCNNKTLIEYAEKNSICSLWYEDLYPQHRFNISRFKALLVELKENHSNCFVSVDIDAFSSAYAPGCSQSWSTGLDPASFFEMFHLILENFDVKTLGIYEVSPPLDSNKRTSRLAAQIAYRYLESL